MDLNGTLFAWMFWCLICGIAGGFVFTAGILLRKPKDSVLFPLLIVAGTMVATLWPMLMFFGDPSWIIGACVHLAGMILAAAGSGPRNNQ